MNKTTFYQKAFPFNSIYYELTEEGLSVNNKSLFKKEAFSLKYEEVGVKRIHSRKVRPRSVMASLLLIFITVLMYVQDGTGAEKYAWLFYLGVTIIVSSVALLSYRKSFYLAQRNHANAIEFFVSRHSREAVESFINEIIARRRAYLLEKYGRFNRLLSYEQQYHNLMWLADLDVLDNAEYLERLDELNHLFNITRELRGFQINLN